MQSIKIISPYFLLDKYAGDVTQKVTVYCGVLSHLQNPGNSKSISPLSNTYSGFESIVKIQVCDFIDQQFQNNHGSILWSL